MSQQHARVAIMGGGLSGLYAAHLLEQQGIRDWVLFEGRPSLGGRVLSFPAVTQAATCLDRFDLGPTWFWPDFQSQLDAVIDELGLTRFPQFDAGDTMVERTAQEPARRVHGYANSPPSMRLAGGMATLIDSLSSRLDAGHIHLQHSVRALRCTGTHVEVDVETPAEDAGTWQVDHVLVAMPPRLAIQTLECDPPLPPPLQAQWAGTPTWMAPHAKFIAVYDNPFWRDAGLSGQARSACGPMVEIHDASMPGGSAALFGFVGVPARVRRTLTEEALRAHCLAQLVRLFGNQAAVPKAQFFKDWASDPFTATLDDLNSDGQHASAPHAFPDRGLWQGRITGIGSEWSPQYPGYLAGCVEAASLGVRALAKQFAPQATPL